MQDKSRRSSLGARSITSNTAIFDAIPERTNPKRGHDLPSGEDCIRARFDFGDLSYDSLDRTAARALFIHTDHNRSTQLHLGISAARQS